MSTNESSGTNVISIIFGIVAFFLSFYAVRSCSSGSTSTGSAGASNQEASVAAFRSGFMTTCRVLSSESYCSCAADYLIGHNSIDGLSVTDMSAMRAAASACGR